MTEYPYMLHFGQLEPTMLLDIQNAATQLGLAYRTEGSSIDVSVQSPMDAFNLGLEQRKQYQRRTLKLMP